MEKCFITPQMLTDYTSMDLLVYAYLCTATSNNEVTTCLKWICQGIGYAPKTGENRPLTSVRASLARLLDDGLVALINPRQVGKKVNDDIKNNEQLTLKLVEIAHNIDESVSISLVKSDIVIIAQNEYNYKCNIFAVLLFTKAQKLSIRPDKEILVKLTQGIPSAKIKRIKQILINEYLI